MTRFVDGPAKGKTLMLKRAARFLRVVEENGQFDALDQLHDTPSAGERIYAYEITAMPGHAFVDFGGKAKKASGCYVIAEYRFVTEQPTDTEMRDGIQWHKWFVAHPQRDDLLPQK